MLDGLVQFLWLLKFFKGIDLIYLIFLSGMHYFIEF